MIEKSDAVFFSPMGLERSGLAITLSRYSEAVREFGMSPTTASLGSVDYQESRVDRLLPRLDELQDLLDENTQPPLFCLGLHPDDEVLEQQMKALSLAFRSGSKIALIPERTCMPESSAYKDLLPELQGFVSAFVHFNKREHAVWKERCPSVPSLVIPPPVPARYFRVADLRESATPKSPARLIAIGRLSARKGMDRVCEQYISARNMLAEHGVELAMTFVGRDYGEDGDRWIADTVKDTVAMSPLNRHYPHLDATRLRNTLLSADLGVALSRQDFDGIAVSEMLASGLPVVASASDGNLALSEESASVLTHVDIDTVAKTIVHVVKDPATRSQLSIQASRDMQESRSSHRSGTALSSLLKSL